MQLFGKVSSNRKTLDLNTNPEILVNMKSGRLSLSTGITNILGNDFLLGFGYDESEDAEVKACLYKVEDGNGIKVGKKGTAGSTWHVEKLKSMLVTENEGEEVTRFKVNVDMVNTSQVDGVTVYNISLKEILPNIVKAKVEKITVEEPRADSTDIFYAGEAERIETLEEQEPIGQ